MLNIQNFNDNKRLTERKFHLIGNSDPIINLYFSPNNIKFIQQTVKDYIKKHTRVDINTEQDENVLVIKMQEYVEMYRANRHLLNGQNDTRFIVKSLNKQVIEHYINQVISSIHAYTHYHFLIANPPTNYIPMPENVSVKGANVLGVNVGFLSSHDRNQNIRKFNLNTKN